MKIHPGRKAIALILASVLFSTGAVAAGHEGHEDHEGHRKAAGKAAEKATAPEVEISRVQVDIPDVELLDQDGRKVKFASDVIGDRLAVIDVIYTTCPVVCPILSAIFSGLQEPLGDRLGKEVSLVSISVDPITDIPPRLKEYAGRYDARAGWIFLTGDLRNITKVLKGLGGYTPDFSQHPTMILVGDGRDGGWTKFYGFPSPDQILEKVNELAAARRKNPSPPAR